MRMAEQPRSPFTTSSDMCPMSVTWTERELPAPESKSDGVGRVVRGREEIDRDPAELDTRAGAHPNPIDMLLG